MDKGEKRRRIKKKGTKERNGSKDTEKKTLTKIRRTK